MLKLHGVVDKHQAVVIDALFEFIWISVLTVENTGIFSNFFADGAEAGVMAYKVYTAHKPT